MGSAQDSSREWREIVRQKRQQQGHALEAFTGLLGTPDGDKITAITDIEELAGKLSAGKLTSQQVAEAYIARAIQAHKTTNCLTEILFEEAIARARELDQWLAKEGVPIGPLHGIPITVKDQFNIAGHDSTLGYTGRAFKPASSDAVLVTILRNMGAIIVAKTNLPQSIMWCETDNPLWGLTTNPMNPRYTPGGSTGGESALLAMQGCILGWGTDIGGSVRIPAHMLGLYGLKPSSARLPYSGVPVSTEGQEHVYSSVGPLCRSLSSVHFAFKEVILAEPWAKDSHCVPIPWRDNVYNDCLSRKLTIGVLPDDGVVRPHPSITRVLRNAVDLLEQDGHEIVPWNVDLHAECIEVMDLYYTADGGEDIRRDVQAGGEPYIPHVEKLVNRGQAISVYDYWQLNRRKKALRQAYLEKWNSIRSPTTGKPVDVILMPVMPHSAVPHRACRWVGYTKVWNLLDYTAMAIPGGRVERQDCEVAWDFEARNEMDEWNMKVWDDNKAEMADMNLPVGVQIIGRNLEEEKVCAVSHILDKLIRS